ncbi:AI-2E family transporter [Methanothermobacter sp.]|uniref:AI-2E family transporter n=1 Tax=Methanothermobacter sp. TaxID=1884223 RepID=UPI002623C64E|nr:AI-2E family transporter [Methanothermobacter sp.]MDI9614865.1 AI-2E family transporter [Methanothermobacter sp.]
MIEKLRGTITSTSFLVLALILLSAIVIYPIWTMLFLGAVFAYIVRPVALRINERIPYLSVSIIIAMVVVIMPLVGIVVFTVDSLINSTPSLITLARGFDIPNLPGQLQSSGGTLGALRGILTDILSGSLNYVIDVIQSVPMIALQLFIFLSSTFYFARDGERLLSYIRGLIPPEARPFMGRMASETERVLMSIFYGHFLTALLIGIMAGVGFHLLGYPYAILLGIITGIFQLIPVIGPWAAYTPLAIYDFVTGNILRGVLVLIFGIFLSTIDIYLRPKLSGKYADIHPMIFLVGFLGGPVVWGVAGFIVGPLVLGLAYAALEAYRLGESAGEENR